MRTLIRIKFPGCSLHHEPAAQEAVSFQPGNRMGSGDG
jgi:hypothetical protein